MNETNKITKSQIKYMEQHSLSEPPKCPVCGNYCPWDTSSYKGFATYCSNECSKSPKAKAIKLEKTKQTKTERHGDANYTNRDKAKETMIEKYGVEHFTNREKAKSTMLERYSATSTLGCPSLKEKVKQTNLEKYGNEWFAGTEEHKQKSIETMIEKYGVENYSQTDEYEERRKETCLEKYGVESYSQTDEFKEKCKNVCLEKYGVEHYSQTAEYKEKYKEACLEKYGVDNVFKSEEFKQHLKQYNIEHYGVEHFTQSAEGRNSIQQSRRNKYWDTFKIKLQMKYIEPLFSKEQYCDLCTNNTLQYKCLKCGKIFTFVEINPNIIHCNCSISHPQQDIQKWINDELGIETVDNKYYTNNDIKKQIDIFIPQFNLGIELHGNYWHCDLNVHNNYHKDKYIHFKDLNISLIQVFESEWLSKQSIVKSIIRNKLKLNETIYARKCIIKEIDNDMYNLFCEQNHLQGYTPSKIRIGLFYNEELVQLVSFSKPRFNKNKNENEYELIRSCTRINYNVAGGFNKLFKYFIKKYNPISITTFCDVRYFDGKGYEVVGFEFVVLTPPDFYYIHKSNWMALHHRLNFQKHLLSRKLESFDISKTAEMNMLENGYVRIFDAGNLKFVWTKKKEQ